VKINVSFDKKKTAQAYLKADDYFLALYDVYHMLISAHKYEGRTVDELYEAMQDILSDYSINIYDDPDFGDDVS
jgi:hypothetical protein